MTPDACAARAVYSSSGRPASGRIFFPGTPFEPPRAGTRPSTIAATQTTSRSGGRGAFCT